MFRFTMMNHMCRDMEQVHDTSLPPDTHPPGREPQPGWRQPHLPEQLHRLSQRHGSVRAAPSPTTTSTTARPEAPGTMRLVYTRGTVQPKYFNNNTNFAPGFITPDDAVGTTAGARARTRCSAGARRCRAAALAPRPWAKSSPTATAFAQCQVEKVFKTVCFRAPGNAADRIAGRRP